jgi:predicted PurR-regulated permease PerM
MDKSADHRDHAASTIETAIKLGLIALLVVWCFRILEPFIILVLWGLIIAIAVFPAYQWLETRLGHRRKLAATLLSTGILLMIVASGTLITDSLIDGIAYARQSIQGEISIPPVPEVIVAWPIVGKPIADMWNMVRTNLGGVLSSLAPQLKSIAVWILESAMSVGGAFLTFLISTIIAGVFLAVSEGGANTARDIGKRLVGSRGDEFVKDAELTVRNVATGVLGVALIQALIAGLGFFVAGVPAAGIWTMLCVFLSVVQIGIGPVVIPVAIYMFYNADMVTATLLAIWLLFALIIDNVLKPILLGRKAPVPMVVVFLGSLGGFLLSGIIGLFVGAVILSLGYKLFLAWLRE